MSLTFATLAQSEPPNVLKLLAHEIRWQLLAALAYSDYRVNVQHTCQFTDV